MNESNQSESSSLAKEVVALGKKYSSGAFPNPDREGCPSRSTLRAMAHRDRRLTLNDLPVSHVVSCSPCFQEYTQLRRAAALIRGIQLVAASLVVLAVVFVAARYVRDYSDGRYEPSISQEKRTDPQTPLATKRPPATAPFSLKVDLASFSPTRGEEAKTESGKKIHLPRKSLRVNFLLPFGMEPGEYSVRLQGSNGDPLADTRAVARMNDGVTSLEVDLDLVSAPQGSFTLMIRPPGLSWRRYPVVVE